MLLLFCSKLIVLGWVNFGRKNHYVYVLQDFLVVLIKAGKNILTCGNLLILHKTKVNFIDLTQLCVSFSTDTSFNVFIFKTHTNII